LNIKLYDIMLSKDDYLMHWGIDYVDNFIDAKKKIKRKNKSLRPKTPEETEVVSVALTEKGLVNFTHKLNKLGTIPKKSHSRRKVIAQEPIVDRRAELLKKISKPEQFTHLQRFIEKKPEEPDIVVVSAPEDNTGKYILLDPAQEEHKKWGFIYLDDETKVSNSHFRNFQLDKYVKYKPQKVIENALKATEAQKKVKVSNPVKIDYSDIGLPDPNQEFKLVPRKIHFHGMWNADKNRPQITSGQGKPGDFYIVSHTGNTEIDGINLWREYDVIYFDTQWHKMKNLA